MKIEDLNGKKFDLFGTTWTINIVDKIEDDNDSSKCYCGMTYHAKQIISIARNVNGDKISDESLRITLYHELVHAICSVGNYLSINNDEPFVEFMARCIMSLIKQDILCK